MVPLIDWMSGAHLPLVRPHGTVDVEPPTPRSGDADDRPGHLPTSSNSAPAESERGRHVLVVDDRDDVRQVLLDLLAEAGYRTSSAARGEAVRAFLKQHRPDVILLDVVLPGEGGIQLARHARSLNIPVLMMSGHPDSLGMLENSGLPFMAKPFRSKELLAALRVAQAPKLPHRIRAGSRAVRSSLWCFRDLYSKRRQRLWLRRSALRHRHRCACKGSARFSPNHPGC
jgi:CheY-like chemotaxis protein